ncbi:MAG TPA: hypothetical protein VKA36_01945 [Solirubrobacterales bacterium]|nr:hypothetical protein [Solirubrobacterales bacterium]
MSKRVLTLLALMAALALGVAACGDDDSSSTSTDSSEEPVAVIDSLSGEQTAVTLDGDFVQALTDLEVTPGTVGDAKLKDGVVSFPITGGDVTYYDPSQPLRPYVQGTINHDGSGLSLEAGGILVELTDFVIDPGTSELTGNVAVDGETAAEGALLFDLDGSTLNPLEVNEDAGTATLEGTTVELSDDAAGLLNDTFGIDALEGGLVIGISEITVAPVG